MEALKDNIAANEGLKKWLDNNLLKRKMWFDNCKNKIKDLEREIAKDKKRLAKLTESVAPHKI
jgi:hypothetical protein